MDKMKKYQRAAFLVLLILAAAILLPELSGITAEEILAYTPKNPLLAVAVLISLYSLKSLVCAIPMTVLYISAGIMFPPVWAVAATYAGLVCEISIGYWIGRYMGGERVLAIAGKNKKAAKAAEYISRHSNVAVFMVRIVPGPLPFDIMSWLFGASHMRFASYLLYSLLGVSAAMLPWVLGGNSITNPLSMEFLTPFLICAAIAGALLFLLRFIEKRRSTRHMESSAETHEK